MQGRIFRAVPGARVATLAALVLSCLGQCGFYDLYQAAAGFGFQTCRNRAVFSSSMLAEIRFQEKQTPLAGLPRAHAQTGGKQRSSLLSPSSQSVPCLRFDKIAASFPEFWLEFGLGVWPSTRTQMG